MVSEVASDIDRDLVLPGKYRHGGTGRVEARTLEMVSYQHI